MERRTTAGLVESIAGLYGLSEEQVYDILRHVPLYWQHEFAEGLIEGTLSRRQREAQVKEAQVEARA